jgi:hypothetical protein
MVKKPLYKSQQLGNSPSKENATVQTLAALAADAAKAKRDRTYLGLRDKDQFRTVPDPLDRIGRVLGKLPPQHRLDKEQAAAVTQAVADYMDWLFGPGAEANPNDDKTARTPEPTTPDDPALPEPPLSAPVLWKARDLNLRENAPQFIRRVYANWLGRGLERKDIARLDPDLYKALSVWLSRHPEDPIVADLPPLREKLDELIDELSAKYPLEDLRKLGHAINARLRRKQNKSETS